MKRIKRKIKELMSRPSKKYKNMKKAVMEFTESSLHKMKASPVQQSSGKPNFSLEEEAAQMAYRLGWDLPANHFNLVNSLVGSDIKEEFTAEPAEDKEIIVRERDPMIERLEKRVNMSEKEGWEALYN